MSHRPYAVDLDSLRVEHSEGVWSHATVNAVWFRRRRGITVACIGHLWDVQDPAPADAADFLTRHDDGRYGGTCRSRWDGVGFWSASHDPDVHGMDLALLRRFLLNYEDDPKNPRTPRRFTGWWVF